MISLKDWKRSPILMLWEKKYIQKQKLQQKQDAHIIDFGGSPPNRTNRSRLSELLEFKRKSCCCALCPAERGSCVIPQACLRPGPVKWRPRIDLIKRQQRANLPEVRFTAGYYGDN